MKKQNRGLCCSRLEVLAYMAINIDIDDNKPHIFINQRFMILITGKPVTGQNISNSKVAYRIA